MVMMTPVAPNWMAERDGTTVWIDLVGINFQFLIDSEGLRREGFVGFNDIKVGNGHVEFFHEFRNRWNWANPHCFGGEPRHGRNQKASPWLQPGCVGGIGTGQHDRRRTIILDMRSK